MQNEKNLLANETLSQKLLKKGFWLYFFGYIIAPLGYLVRLFISNSPEVSVSDFGVMYSIISLITFLYTYNDLGLTESLQYFLPRFYLKKEYNNIKTVIRLSLLAQIGTGIIIMFALRFGSDRLAQHYFQNDKSATILKYFCLYFIGNNIFQVLQSIFSAFQKTFESQFVDFIRRGSIFLFTLFCFFTGKGTIERYSLNRVIGIGAGIIMAAILYKKYRPSLMQGKFSWDEITIKKYTKYALRAFIGSNIGGLFGQIIQQMVLYFLGPTDAGYYSNFLSLFYIGTLMLGPIIALIFPMVSEIVEKNNKEKLSLLFSFFYNYFSIITISFSILFITLGPEIAIALFGNNYITSGNLLCTTGIFLIFSLLSSINYASLAGIGKVKERVYITGISCILTIIICYFSIKIRNIYGAGISFGLSNLITRGLSFYLIKKENIEIKLNQKFIIKNLILFTGLGISIYLIKNSIINLSTNRRYIILQLILTGLIFYAVIGLCNTKALKILKSEIKKIK